jgi:leader peptidase (prepilin peptidase)/N-methyltransferase
MALILGLLFGAFIGSFLNVCVHRLPRNESVVRPPSRCYACGARVRWYDNLPVVSYLVLRGRCRWCDTRYSARYLVLEVLVAAITGLIAWWAFGDAAPLAPWLLAAGAPTWAAQAAAGVVLLCFAWFLVVATLIDLEHLIIPDELTKSFQFAAPFLATLCATNADYGWDVGDWLLARDVFGGLRAEPGRFLGVTLGIVGAVLAVLLASLPLARWIYSTACPPSERWRDEDHRGFRLGVLWFVAVTALAAASLAALALTADGRPARLLASIQFGQALLGSCAGWCSLYLVGLIGTLAFRKNAMGFGDVKFLAPIGAFLGPIGVLYAFFGAAVAGSIIGLPMYLLHRRRQIPFGPYLAIGTVLAVVAGPRLHAWVFAGLFAR